MPGHDIIVVGASAGGVEALCQMIPDFPQNLPAAIFVVLHIPAQSTSVLPKILNRTIQRRNPGSSLKAFHPQDGEKIEYGRIYVAPPDQHLLIKNGYIRLARGPRENNHRPAVDPLFRTAARIYGPRVVGVVLSGTLDDGSAGLLAVKQQGGVAIVQDPDEALYSGMPRNAIENVEVDQILQVVEITPVLVELAHELVEEAKIKAVSGNLEMETDMAELELTAMQNSDRPGTPSPYSCPDCGGTLWELDELGLIRFRCRTGHAYSVNTLLAKQSEAVEDTLWVALRALEEKAALAERMTQRARQRQQNYSAKRFRKQEQEVRQHAAVIRQLLLNNEGNGEVSTNNGEVLRQDLQALVSGQPTTTNEETKQQKTNDITFKVVTIGADAGGMKALTEVLSALPSDFPAAITVVHYLHSEQSSLLVDILKNCTSLTVKQAESGDVLRPGTVYIAPQNQHLLVHPDNTLSLSSSELVHFLRPSVDLLFESVAASYKQHAIAVVLTGKGSNGAMGVRAIKEMGGATIVQNDATCEYFGMPQAAINTGSVDLVLPLNEIAATLKRLVTSKNKEPKNS